MSKPRKSEAPRSATTIVENGFSLVAVRREQVVVAACAQELPNLREGQRADLAVAVAGSGL
jgi:hypothetical protein